MPRKDHRNKPLISLAPNSDFLSREEPRDPNSLSTKRTVDFSTVPVMQMREEVRKRAVQYLGQKEFNRLGLTLRQTYAAHPNARNTVQGFSIAMSMVGMEGHSTILMLIIEWKLQGYFVDFADEYAQWFAEHGGAPVKE